MATPFPEYDSDSVLEAFADFSGRPSASFSPYALTAYKQALLLFKIGTCLHALPDDETDQALAIQGILSMADQFYLANQYREATASPFTSESIGSYNYNKAARQVSRGEDTGVMWFDLAVSRLGQCDADDGLQMHGGIEVFEHDILTVRGSSGANRRMLSPQDMHLSASYGVDPAEIGFRVGSVG